MRCWEVMNKIVKWNHTEGNRVGGWESGSLCAAEHGERTCICLVAISNKFLPYNTYCRIKLGRLLWSVHKRKVVRTSQHGYRMNLGSTTETSQLKPREVSTGGKPQIPRQISQPRCCQRNEQDVWRPAWNVITLFDGRPRVFDELSLTRSEMWLSP